jgi:shikimate kinase
MQLLNIFLIGPASVGKTTTGRLLARKLERKFVDIDFRFCEQIALIPHYIQGFGYPAYCEANSRLVDQLLEEYPANTVFATPSGFLAHEDSSHLVDKHLQIISHGISVLLLPSTTPEEGVELIVRRQLNRYPEVKADIERQRFMSRFEKYKNTGDIKIVTKGGPEVVVDRIVTALQNYKGTRELQEANESFE